MNNTPEARVDDALRDLARSLRQQPRSHMQALQEARDNLDHSPALRDLWQQLLVTWAALRDVDAVTLDRLEFPARVVDEGGVGDVP